jgi:broad specificity phosphatase PhoE
MRMRATFIRHGESTGNAGIPCADLALLELTVRGWNQAREVASSWSKTPDLIVISPHLRAQQTAQPTIERFPGVPVEIWPIHEFTYLEPTRWNGTWRADRLPHIEAYWDTADPDYCDGPGAESFSALLTRAGQALERLSALHNDSEVLLFSHGQLIHAVRILLLYPDRTNRERMRLFWRKDGQPAVQNAELVETVRTEEGWRLKPPKMFISDSTQD